MPPYNTVGDNSPLISNIADFLLSGQRKDVLTDFPYIFNGSTVDILPTSKVAIDRRDDRRAFQASRHSWQLPV